MNTFSAFATTKSRMRSQNACNGGFKPLRLAAVCAAFSLLLERDGRTTNLDVKLFLREMGYLATQKEVRRLVNKMLENELCFAQMTIVHSLGFTHRIFVKI